MVVKKPETEDEDEPLVIDGFVGASLSQMGVAAISSMLGLLLVWYISTFQWQEREEIPVYYTCCHALAIVLEGAPVIALEACETALRTRHLLMPAHPLSWSEVAVAVSRCPA